MRYTTSELAKKCGVTNRSITKYANAIGLSKIAGRWEFSEEEAQAIIEHYAIAAKPEQSGTNQTQSEQAGTEPVPQGICTNQTELVPNETEPEQEPDGTETERGSDMQFALDILQKQLDEKDKMIERLLSMVAEKDSQIKELSSGYVAEKTAESLERGRAALSPVEEDSEEQPRKISFGQRLKFLFTGVISDSKIDI